MIRWLFLLLGDFESGLERFLKVLQIVFGKVMLVASLAVDRPFGEWLRVNIKFAQAVDSVHRHQ